MVLPVSIRWKVELASVRKYSRRLHPTHGAIGLAIPHREMKKNTRSVGVTRARRAGERVQCECREEHERERGEKENEDIEREDACWGNIGESLSPCMRHAHLWFIRCQTSAKDSLEYRCRCLGVGTEGEDKKEGENKAQ